MARTVTVAGALLALVLVPLGCGENERVAAVNGEPIHQRQVESLIELYKSRAEAREGESEQKSGGEEVSHAQELGALQVLVEREILEQKAEELGVTVEEDAVDELAERLEGPESARRADKGPGEEEQEKELREQIRETARAQLLYRALYRRVTRKVRVARSEIVAYYRSHRSSYPTVRPRKGNVPPPSVEQAIRRGLTATARDQAMAHFVARMRREFSSRIEYSKGWSPQSAKR